MSGAETGSTPNSGEKAPLSQWQRWLEFLQVTAVLIIAAGVILPFGFGLQSTGAWLGAAALAIAGVVVAFLALRLIDVDYEIVTDQKFEITSMRLLTLGEIGAAPDVVDALRDMCGPDTQWGGSAAKLRDDFYARIGEKRGAEYLRRILPYLAVYTSPSPRS